MSEPAHRPVARVRLALTAAGKLGAAREAPR